MAVREPSRTGPAPQGRHPAPEAEAPLALVVDDEPQVRRLVSTVLRRHGWSVLEAPDATAALALARTDPPDLLVTDYDMPDASGVDLAERLRLSDEDLPVVVVSGHPEAVRSLARLRGRAAFNHKPFDPDDLVSSVRSIARRARLPRPTSDSG